MNLNRADLRKLSYDFNSIASRLLRADCEDYVGVLKKFIAFLETNEVINEYLIACGEATFDVALDAAEIAKSYGQMKFGLGDLESEEDANVYAILKYLSTLSIHQIISVIFGYSSSNKYQEKIKGFNERVSMVLIRHVEGYLTKLGIDMGVDEHINYNITVTNGQGQVNLATDYAVINATLNNGVDIDKLDGLIEAVRSNSHEGLSEEDREAVDESLTAIEDELKKDKPKKGIVIVAIKALQAIAGTAGFLAAVAQLVEFIQNAIAQAAQV